MKNFCFLKKVKKAYVYFVQGSNRRNIHVKSLILLFPDNQLKKIQKVAQMEKDIFVTYDKNDGKALKGFDLYAIIIVAAEYVRLLLL